MILCSVFFHFGMAFIVKCSLTIHFPIFKVSRLVRVHTDSHHNGHNKMIFAVSDV